MTKLVYPFTNDILFKMLFVKYPDLLKQLVSELLAIPYESILRFDITNPEIPPESMGDKFCRLDINMVVDDRRVDLEIQVRDEDDYPERSLFYWAREYSSALGEGYDYQELPRVVVISILDFRLFSCENYHSEYQALEVTSHQPLTDRMSLHYFELPKLPNAISREERLKLWLALFKVKTEEELKKIEELEVPIMEQTIQAYRSITATSEFQTLERIRSDARRNEAAALRHAAEIERAKWMGIVADAVAEKDDALAQKNDALAQKNDALAQKDDALAQKNDALAELAKTKALLAKFLAGDSGNPS
jgi:predicted transposase/invertase (TIGR01784 family)